MKTVRAHLKSAAPYSQSRNHETPLLNKEKPAPYDQRTWREKCNYHPETGMIFIPPMAFKQALDAAAKLLSVKVEGKGKATYTKHFRSGVICSVGADIGVHKDEVPSIKISANSNGIRGTGSRVPRIFPQVDRWEGTADFVVLDDTITRSVFEEHMIAAGQFIGVGRFRAENGGLNGRFNVAKFEWMK